MSTPNLDQSFLRLYADLMDEVKARLRSWDYLLATYPDLLKSMPRGVEEFGYLQIRMSCELIALGCLVAHNSNKAAFRLKIARDWHVKDIMRALERLHPAFFPVPMQWIGPEPLACVAYPDTHKYLTKESLIDLYELSGRYLHRGTLGELTRPTPRLPPTDTAKINEYMQQIIDLLKLHKISLNDKRTALTIRMKSPPDGHVMGGVHPDIDIRQWRWLRLIPFHWASQPKDPKT